VSLIKAEPFSASPISRASLVAAKNSTMITEQATRAMSSSSALSPALLILIDLHIRQARMGFDKNQPITFVA
jgi:hypothetical protein